MTKDNREAAELGEYSDEGSNDNELGVVEHDNGTTEIGTITDQPEIDSEPSDDEPA